MTQLKELNIFQYYIFKTTWAKKSIFNIYSLLLYNFILAEKILIEYSAKK